MSSFRMVANRNLRSFAHIVIFHMDAVDLVYHRTMRADDGGDMASDANLYVMQQAAKCIGFF